MPLQRTKEKPHLMRWKSGRCPGEASFSGIHTDRPVRLVALKSQTGSDGHPFFVTDIVGLARTLAASAVLSEKKNVVIENQLLGLRKPLHHS